ncbi:MAG: hypothetical protein JWL63_455 [Rhodocyclales bacterium]|nr:hypothetical protein [Rhodocyclales bacterium]
MRANRLPAARGWYWFVGGLQLWRRSPGIIGLAAMLSFLLSAVVGSVPWLGAVLICLIGPFIDIFLLRVCHLVDLGRRPTPRDFTVDLKSTQATDVRPRVIGLLILGGVTFAGLMLSKLLMSLLAGDAMAQLAIASQAAGASLDAAVAASAPVAASSAGSPVTLAPNVILALFFNLGGIFVLSIVMWIAPALTAFAGVPPLKSLFFSIVACWQNKAAFLVFGLSLASLSIPMSLLMMLGGLGQTLVMMVLFGVLMPACFASNYLSVTDIFGPLPAPRDAG